MNVVLGADIDSDGDSDSDIRGRNGKERTKGDSLPFEHRIIE